MKHQPNLAPSKSLLVTVLEREKKRERILIQPRTLQRELEESGGPFVWKEEEDWSWKGDGRAVINFVSLS